MKFFQEFFIIIFFSVLGEGIRIFAHLPIPGSILGILFLFLAFEMHLVDPEKIGATGDFLLNNLAILFVPAGVGLLEYFDDIASIWPVLMACFTGSSRRVFHRHDGCSGKNGRRCRSFAGLCP